MTSIIYKFGLISSTEEYRYYISEKKKYKFQTFNSLQDNSLTKSSY